MKVRIREFQVQTEGSNLRDEFDIHLKQIPQKGDYLTSTNGNRYHIDMVEYIYNANDFMDDPVAILHVALLGTRK